MYIFQFLEDTVTHFTKNGSLMKKIQATTWFTLDSVLLATGKYLLPKKQVLVGILSQTKSMGQ